MLINIGMAIGGAMLLLAILGLGIATIMPGIDRWSKRFFTCFFAILALGMVFYIVDMIAYGNPDMVLEEITAAFFESVSILTLIAMMPLYLLHCCKEDWRTSALFRATFALYAVAVVLMALAPFTPILYSYMPDNELHRGPLYQFWILLPTAILILTMVGVVRRQGKLSRRLAIAFFVFLTPMTISLIVHFFVTAFALIDISLVISALTMYGIAIAEQVDQYTRQQREIARQRASIMVLQMRPHFIHNTMTSIYYLCEQDPKKAQQVTLDFNTYLRKNFNAIGSEETIPFLEELEHTRAYLAVEQAQFADKLQVEFDTPHTRFRIPPLTLQPLAENAVKHGMNPGTVPLRVIIRTRKTDAGSEIAVEDNGLGYNPANDDRTHTTLTNIQQRLEMMCDGELSISPREGSGTVVKVTIPRHNA